LTKYWQGGNLSIAYSCFAFGAVATAQKVSKTQSLGVNILGKSISKKQYLTGAAPSKFVDVCGTAHYEIDH